MSGAWEEKRNNIRIFFFYFIFTFFYRFHSHYPIENKIKNKNKELKQTGKTKKRCFFIPCIIPLSFLRVKEAR
jgi:hypothetical protein